MEDKKTSVWSEINDFVKTNCVPMAIAFSVSFATGYVLGTRTYKKGFDAGHDALANAIFAASQKGEGIVLSNTKYGDHIFKATKILKD